MEDKGSAQELQRLRDELAKALSYKDLYEKEKVRSNFYKSRLDDIVQATDKTSEEQTTTTYNSILPTDEITDLKHDGITSPDDNTAIAVKSSQVDYEISYVVTAHYANDEENYDSRVIGSVGGNDGVHLDLDGAAGTSQYVMIAKAESPPGIIAANDNAVAGDATEPQEESVPLSAAVNLNTLAELAVNLAGERTTADHSEANTDDAEIDVVATDEDSANSSVENRKNGAKIRKRSQKAKRLHTCCHCGKQFPRSSDMRRHELIHAEDKPFKCKRCDRMFSNVNSLRRHERNDAKHARQAEQCPYCDLNFYRMRKAKRKAHINQHLDISIFHECTKCKKTFSSENYLKIHTKICNGIKEFSCRFCTMKFARKVTCENHENIHTGHTPYKCIICDLAFKTYNLYRKHGLKVHKASGSKDFKKMLALAEQQKKEADS